MKKPNIISNIEELSLKQASEIVKSLSLKALISIMTLFIGYTTLIFLSGQVFQANMMVVEFERPFGITMNHPFSTQLVKKLENGEFPYPDLIATPDYSFNNGDENKIIAKLRLRRSENDGPIYDEIGTLITDKNNITSTFGNISYSLLGKAYAQDDAKEDFDWENHKNNYDFYEKFVNKTTIHRYYDDGWILEYKVDRQGQSISSSLKWVKKD